MTNEQIVAKRDKNPTQLVVKAVNSKVNLRKQNWLILWKYCLRTFTWKFCIEISNEYKRSQGVNGIVSPQLQKCYFVTSFSGRSNFLSELQRMLFFREEVPTKYPCLVMTTGGTFYLWNRPQLNSGKAGSNESLVKILLSIRTHDFYKSPEDLFLAQNWVKFAKGRLVKIFFELIRAHHASYSVCFEK